MLSKEESNLVKYIDSADSSDDPEQRYSVTVNVNVTFSRSKVKEALQVQLSGDPNAAPIILTEEQIRQRYRLTYSELVAECKKRYANFKLDKNFHAIKKVLETDIRYAKMRLLDSSNPKSSKKIFYSEAILRKLDDSYSRMNI